MANNVNTTVFRGRPLENRLTKSIASGSLTLTVAEAMYGMIEFTGTITIAKQVIFPTVDGMMWFVKNNTSGDFPVYVKTSAGTGIYVYQGKTAAIYCDGTNIVALDSDPVVSGAAQLTVKSAVSVPSGASYTLGYLESYIQNYFVFSGQDQACTVTFRTERPVAPGELVILENSGTFTITALNNIDLGNGVPVFPKEVVVVTAGNNGTLYRIGGWLQPGSTSDTFDVPLQVGMKSFDCAGGGTITGTLPDAYAATLKFTGAPGAGFNFVVPTIAGLRYLVWNATGQTATVKTAGGSGIAIATAKAAMVFCDGTDVKRLSADTTP